MRITLICEEDTLLLDEDQVSNHDGTLQYVDVNEAGIVDQDDNFMNALRYGQPVITTGRNLLPTMRTLQRLEISAGNPT